MSAPITQKNPPPILSQLHKLQLMRTTLVSLLDSKSFATAVRGCFVRVLLQMHSDRATENVATADNYYIALVKGAKKGPTYSGFSCDGATTDWHIEIELPPVFRATSNGNILQLNSISNTQFKPSEYESWVTMNKQHNIPMITNAQVELRLKLLEEEKAAVSAFSVLRKKCTDTTGDEELTRLRAELEHKIREQLLLLPLPDQLVKCPLAQLQQIEQTCLDFVCNVRIAINERTKCMLCKEHVANVILLPCKHQVLCKACMDCVTVCPAQGCEEIVQQRFDLFT